MNFHFVDRILSCEPGKHIVGLKHVTASDIYLRVGQNGQPALLSCIIGEALGQLAAWCVLQANDFYLRPVAGIVGEVEVCHEVYLGDSILLESTIDSADSDAVHYHSIATVRGKKVLALHHAIGPFLPMEQFNDPHEVRAHFALINRPGEIPHFLEGRATMTYRQQAFQRITCDSIIVWESGEHVVAQKNISLIAPYFADHFPRKPVFPLSLLLECKLHLAQMFLEDLLGKEQIKFWTLQQIRKIKMNDFIQPGDIIFVNLHLQKRDEQQVILNFSTETNQKKVCVAQVIFNKL